MKSIGIKGIGCSIVLVALIWGIGAQAKEKVSMQRQIEQRQQLNDSRYKKIKELSDKAVARFLWEQEQSNYSGMIELLAINSTPYEIEYSPSALARLGDYDNRQMMSDAFLDSLLAVERNDYYECKRYSDKHGFAFRKGFSFPFSHRLKFSELVLDDGETLRIPELTKGEMEIKDIIRRGDTYCVPALEQKNAAQPVAVKGEFYTELPDKLVQFELNANDVGKIQEKDGYRVTLVEMNDFSYVIEVDVETNQNLTLREQDILGEAKAVNGQYVRKRVTEQVPMKNYRKVELLLGELINRAEKDNLTETEAREALTGLNQRLTEKGAPLYSAFAFHGPVDTAKVTILAGGEKRKKVETAVELPVYWFGSEASAGQAGLDGLPTIKATLPIYNHRPEVIADYVDLNAKIMHEEIDIRQRNITHDPGIKHPNQVFLHYPTVQSDLFIPIFDRYGVPDAENVAFFDADGKPLEVADDKNSAFRFTVSRLEYDPSGFTAPPARLKAVIPVLTAPNIIKENYSKSELPKGVRLDGNKLIIDYAEFTPREIQDVSSRMQKRRNQVFTKDSQGYLAEIAMQSITGEKREPVDIYYFYGEPESFEVWYQGETQTINFEFDIEL